MKKVFLSYMSYSTPQSLSSGYITQGYWAGPYISAHPTVEAAESKARPLLEAPIGKHKDIEIWVADVGYRPQLPVQPLVRDPI